MEALWKHFLDDIKKEVLPENYNTWFSPTYPQSLNDGVLGVIVPNDFFKQCLEENYRDLIHRTLNKITDRIHRVDFIVHSEKEEEHNGNGHEIRIEEDNGSPQKSEWLAKSNGFHSNLNPKYKFSNFIIGSSNQFAHAAALAVAHNPAHTYNPLFIYGSVGLGKTHLLHAIGHTILEANPDARVRYISSESFTIDLIQSLRKDDMASFRKRYRPLDVLLVDDIQFIAGKDRTQEEFFYTFNTLYESHKQVVLSSDKYPKDIHNIEERLRSRFESGLITDIMPPDLETKVAILFKKGEAHGKEIPQEVALFIAKNIKSNIRELEGLLLRIIAFSSFSRKPIDMTLAKEVLKEVTVDKNRNFNIPNIMKSVAIYFNIKVTDIKSKQRNREISLPRQIAMYICREHTSSSLPEIGKQFGGKDHTTVLFAHKKITALVKENNEITRFIQDIVEGIER